MSELHVSLDTVAELRRSRTTGEPEPTAAALAAELAGASGVTAHLRQDQRHIEERDLRLWKETLRIPLTLIINAHDEMLKLALGLVPSRVVLISERREEPASTQGLDLLLHLSHVQRAVRLLREARMKTLLFMEPDLEQLKGASKAGVDGVLLNTLRFSEAFGSPREEEELTRLHEASRVCQKYGLLTGAYRGINYRLAPRLRALELAELHCGHAICSRAVFTGLERAVREMVELVR